MSSLKLRRPSPAFVLAAVALFVALGGTGYAATRPGAEAAPATVAKKAEKSLTKAQVDKLIAGYVGAHKAELRGPAGSSGSPGAPGAPGGEGQRGPAGPGAIPVAMNVSAAQSGPQTVATLGPWTVTLTCSPNSPNANVVIKGPGEVASTASIAAGSSAGATYVGPLTAIGSNGFNAAVNSGAQLSATDFLQSGSTLYELKYQVSAEAGLFEQCDMVGDAIPVS